MGRREKLIEKYGSEEAYLEKQREWASKGGKKAKGRLQHLTAEERSEIGKKGYQAMIQAAINKENV